MQTSLNTSKWYDRVWASLLFFTRLPLWRLYQPPRDAYQTVVEQWPLTGWLTASCMAAMLFFGSMTMPYPIAVVLAITTRLLLTGALHEDGLADCCDGFGGGTDRQRILDIMKDSHIGTYGVLGLIVYFALLFFSLVAMAPADAALIVVAADPFAKMLAAQIVMFLPYARTGSQAKSGVVYRKFSTAASISLALQGMLPVALCLYFALGDRIGWSALLFIPGLVLYVLYRFLAHRLRGYTGDCCGALFLVIELSFYLVAVSFLA